MVVQVPVIPYERYEIIGLPDQFIQVALFNECVCEFFIENEQLIVEYAGVYYRLDMNTRFEDFMRVFNFNFLLGKVFDEVQDEVRDMNAQEVLGKTFSELRNRYFVFTIDVNVI